MGSVRLLEELSVAGDEPGRFRRRLEEYASTLQLPFAGKTKVAGFIATGGNIESLARMAGTIDENGVGRLPLARLREVIEKLASMPYRQRVEQLGLREDRADVILPASMVYERIAVVAGFEEIMVPFVGVKDGVVLDLVDDYTRREPHRRRRDEVVYGGALALGRRYRFDDAHGRHVASLSLALFDQLLDLHGMTDADRTILMAAGVLHDVGTFIGYKKHHKHSLYIISQSELPGFAPNEILMVANVARYHRKGGPANHHELYMALESSERERVAKLAALLRIADALDREHKQTVTAVRALTTPKAVRLEVEGEGDLILERWAVENKRGLFEQTFDNKLRID
jgi:exopolyphosphatase/guanosine-5'-triphosphate,3'-diphosphate pyrophosphatase